MNQLEFEMRDQFTWIYTSAVFECDHGGTISRTFENWAIFWQEEGYHWARNILCLVYGLLNLEIITLFWNLTLMGWVTIIGWWGLRSDVWGSWVWFRWIEFHSNPLKWWWWLNLCGLEPQLIKLEFRIRLPKLEVRIILRCGLKKVPKNGLYV